MKSRRFGFLRHYKKIKVEGTGFNHIVNKCIRSGIALRNLKWRDPLESTMEVQGEDFGRLKKLAGHSYKMTVLKEGGAIPVFQSMRANLLTVAGAFLLGAFLFYQSLFVAEIRIDGYRTVTEASIRSTLEEEGLYEGARKEDDYSNVKARLYQEYDEITWVSIYEDGRLIKVNIAEAGREGEASVPEETPVNIVAARSGMIEKITPLQGNAKVQRGDYVNEGDVLISGRYKYQSSDYSRGDKFFYLYSHAKGQVMARIPQQLTYYFEKNVRTMEPTGRKTWAIQVTAGDGSFELGDSRGDYEVSVREETVLLDLVRFIPFTVKLIETEEVTLKERPREMKELRRVTEAAIRQYGKENLEQGEDILSSTMDFYEEENVIKVNVLLETLQDIGAEKEIKVKKEEKSQQERIEE
ncbi:MAG: sporulation protein YqfD [Bacillota bacterium]|nr:sporulation protein YqfD [Bacillota bacterium]